jgi:membrane protease YdiL (CAAX protease family)
MVKLAILFSLYFACLVFIPWHDLFPESSVPLSYLWDIVFTVMAYFWCRQPLYFRFQDQRLLALYAAVTLSLAVLAIIIMNLIGVTHAFSMLDHLFIEMVVVAPILEELVFRLAFGLATQETSLPERKQALINAGIFSFAHLIAYFVVPDVFKGFIIAQTFYTFFLGYFCFQIFQKTRNILYSIFLHFIFNLTFYAFIKFQWF